MASMLPIIWFKNTLVLFDIEKAKKIILEESRLRRKAFGQRGVRPERKVRYAFKRHDRIVGTYNQAITALAPPDPLQGMWDGPKKLDMTADRLMK